MRILGVMALVLTTGCSVMTSRPTITASTKKPTCTSARPALDSAGAATLGITGTFMVARGDGMTTPGIAALLGAGIYVASAIHGMREEGRCEREFWAAREELQQQQPLHDEAPPAVALTCEQRRLDMYSRAVTGADQEQRVRLLTELPSCEERIARERAWALTRMASLDASAGRCTDIEQLAREIFSLDVVLHDVVLMGDIEVKHCLERREL